jgi:hypothetical protein
MLVITITVHSFKSEDPLAQQQVHDKENNIIVAIPWILRKKQ